MPAPRLAKFRIRSRATIGQFLDDRAMTVGDLAAKAGLSNKTVSLSINGQPMTWTTVARIAHALNVTPDAIAYQMSDDTPESEVVNS
jgi:DNA-binding Xre family transcriptional regulator